MLARLDKPPLVDERLVYEPKYDGIRALIEVVPPPPARRRPSNARSLVCIRSRLGNDKTLQFPEITAALERIGSTLPGPVLVDGEIVALDERGEPAGFQDLQGRMHLSSRQDIERASGDRPVAFIAFDLLRDGAEDLRPMPLAARRVRLEQRLQPDARSPIRLSSIFPGDGRDLYRAAEARGLEGLVAKDVDSPYLSGQRTPFWRKLKITLRQEFIVGGWTDPQNTRQHFGALLLGVAAGEPEARRLKPGARRPKPEARSLTYAGSVGSGFDERELARLAALLKARETQRCPFASVPRAIERAHWVRPDLVVEVRFTEWTKEGYLRHPIYLGQRQDKTAASVVHEHAGTDRAGVRTPGNREPGTPKPEPETLSLLTRLRDLEDRGKDGTIDLPDGHRLKVTNLRKVFWPQLGLTKGELMRYYVQAAPYLLPAVADRPLVMKRFPNGVDRQAFYQQRAPEPLPPGVRAAVVREAGEDPPVPRLVGGQWTTLLYMAQLAAISHDPWFSRIASPLDADHVALDLDPMEGVPFTQVLDVACWIHDELRALKVPAVAKTSGSRGLHIYIPLPPGTPYQAGLLFSQIVATIVAERHPKAATVERAVAQRGRTVYVDYLQNIAGKTLATAYSARASEYAGASTPLTWDEVHAGVDPRAFTIRTLPGRLRDVGDLWARLRTDEPADLHEALRRCDRGRRRR